VEQGQQPPISRRALFISTSPRQDKTCSLKCCTFVVSSRVKRSEVKGRRPKPSAQFSIQNILNSKSYASICKDCQEQHRPETVDGGAGACLRGTRVPESDAAPRQGLSGGAPLGRGNDGHAANDGQGFHGGTDNRWNRYILKIASRVPHTPTRYARKKSYKTSVTSVHLLHLSLEI